MPACTDPEKERERRKKLSDTQKGKPKGPQTEEHRRNTGLANKGKHSSPKPPRTEAHRKHLSEANKGKPGRKHSEEESKRQSERQKGRHETKEANEKRSNTLKGKPHPLPENQGERVSRGRLAKNGTGGPLNWRDYIEYYKFRAAVLTRDSYTCQHCHITEEAYREGQVKKGANHVTGLEVHHIKDGENHPDLRYEVSNGLTLCFPCHAKEERPKMKKKTKKNRIITQFPIRPLTHRFLEGNLL